MNMEQVKEIANAVLYEGYLLYPYRRSAIKNRQRWTFGVVYPKEYSEANGGTEPWTMHTECLVTTRGSEGDHKGSPLLYPQNASTDSSMGRPATSLDIYLRFLHLLSVRRGEGANEWESVGSRAFDTWEEGMEREMSVLHLRLDGLLTHPRTIEIKFSGERILEEATTTSPAMVRELRSLRGVMVIAAEQVGVDLFKLSVQIENRTPETSIVPNRGDAIVLQSFVSTHTLLQVHQGAFISLLETPEELKAAAQGCQNLRTWPVLVGNEGDNDAMLSSPIILYDYPQIAPESPGPLFDGTEIDEILMLRIMTLTDEEKREMREDERAREILERTENITPEAFMKLHGVIRSMRPVEVDEGGIV